MYCTSGVLLRSLMAGEGMISTVTHIIIDEVHERDRLSDFMLIVLREALSKYRSLRLILMSATVDAKQYSSYFNNCPVISGKIYTGRIHTFTYCIVTFWRWPQVVSFFDQNLIVSERRSTAHRHGIITGPSLRFGVTWCRKLIYCRWCRGAMSMKLGSEKSWLLCFEVPFFRLLISSVSKWFKVKIILIAILQCRGKCSTSRSSF